MALLEVEGLTLARRGRRREWFRYEFRRNWRIEDVSFTLKAERSLAVVGEEGSGKADLVEALLFLRPVDEGVIRFAEVEATRLRERQIRRLRKRLQGLFSDDFGQLTPDFTVDAMFREVLGFWYPSEPEERWSERIEAVMIACGLPEALRILYPGELDAVERQLVALARALLLEPDLLVLHDVTHGMDVIQRAELLNRIAEVREAFRLALLVVTDDLAVARRMGDAIAVLHRGKLVELAEAAEVIDRPRHDYTRRLVSDSLKVS